LTVKTITVPSLEEPSKQVAVYACLGNSIALKKNDTGRFDYFYNHDTTTLVTTNTIGIRENRNMYFDPSLPFLYLP